MSLWWVWLLVLWVGGSEALRCEYYNATECGSGPCESSRREIECRRPQGEDHSSTREDCFVVWRRADNQPPYVEFKGCFIHNKECVGAERCEDRTAEPKGKAANGSTLFTHFCCCQADLCNQQFHWNPLPTTPKPKPVLAREESGSGLLYIVWPCVAMLCVLLVGAVWMMNRRRLPHKPLPSSLSQVTDEENILLHQSESANSIPVSLVEVKASGRFGSVWKATMHPSKADFVAVKVLPLREKASWKLEQEVYGLPLMCESQFIVSYFGARAVNMELWLISEYMPLGSLYDYLKGAVLSWAEVAQVSRSMCQGLAFLHEELEARRADGGRALKPSVAHRDFKSKNVLLRSDLTACIADFGLAHIFYPNKPLGTNHGQVGTRRYMAPEVLDGAVSFTRDNFQRIDMYACGLVLWELASRSSCQQGVVGEYRLPFEEFVGGQPSLEAMIETVVTLRRRPTVRNDWAAHPGLAVLTEAMREAWDHDAEARVSASCIVERLNAVASKIIN